LAVVRNAEKNETRETLAVHVYIWDSKSVRDYRLLVCEGFLSRLGILSRFQLAVGVVTLPFFFFFLKKNYVSNFEFNYDGCNIL
jgi:hypothetical protein